MANLFSGNWELNADGYRFNLTIQQQDNGQITGSMTGVNNHETDQITGTVNGKHIHFDRVTVQQHYDGYMFTQLNTYTIDPDRQPIAGTAIPGNTGTFGWYATPTA